MPSTLLIPIFGCVMLAAFVAMTWIGTRRYGWIGLLFVHFMVVFTYFGFAGVSFSLGIYEYDGELSSIGLIVQAFLINCVLLPLAFVALWRRKRFGNARNV